MENPIEAEPIIEPDLPIVDAHHHLWLHHDAFLAAIENTDSLSFRLMAPLYRRTARYLFDEFLGDVQAGHNIRATVYIEAGSMLRAAGPEEMKAVGEVEFANGMAAMAASGSFGETKICAAIVGNVDLQLGDAAKAVMLAQMQAGGTRYRGVRTSKLPYDSDTSIMGSKGGGVAQLVQDPGFLAGFRHLGALGLCFEATLLEPQLPELASLAAGFPDTQIIINHTGLPVGIGSYAGKIAERFEIWRKSIAALARYPNLVIKLGGLGMPMNGLRSSNAAVPFDSLELAKEWRPYFETCIEAFGAERCMFESNFPVDSGTASYPVLWNAFKRTVSGASQDEKRALFSGTASRVYRIDLDG